MKKIINRIVAFIMDLCVAMLLIVGLSSVPFLNPNIKDIDKNYNDLKGEYNKYDNLKGELEIILNDAIINDSELENIKKNYIAYIEAFKDVKINEKMDKDTSSKFEEKIDAIYQEIGIDYSYRINKLSIYESIISIVIYVLYFGVLPYFMKGQTLFKKLFKLRVVDNDDVKLKIPLWKYLIRAFLICELVFNIVDIIFLFVLSKGNYNMMNFWLSEFKYLYEIAFLIVLVIRDDQRSVHDLLLNTRVVRLDKSGNIALESLEDQDSERKLDNQKNHKKEEIKAIKVNDR